MIAVASRRRSSPRRPRPSRCRCRSSAAQQNDRRPLFRPASWPWRPTCRAPAGWPRPTPRAEKTAKLCGSRIVVDVTVRRRPGRRLRPGRQGLRPGPGLAPRCSARTCSGRPRSRRSRWPATRLRAMLQAERSAAQRPLRGSRPCSQPVKDYPARHASTLLAFEAAADGRARGQQSASRRELAAPARLDPRLPTER